MIFNALRGPHIEFFLVRLSTTFKFTKVIMILFLSHIVYCCVSLQTHTESMYSTAVDLNYKNYVRTYTLSLSLFVYD